jgi:hypothetical protein
MPRNPFYPPNRVSPTTRLAGIAMTQGDVKFPHSSQASGKFLHVNRFDEKIRLSAPNALH